MTVAAGPLGVRAGDVSFRVWNAGMTVHELVLLPLPAGRTGTGRGPNGTVNEADSLARPRVMPSGRGALTTSASRLGSTQAIE
jgi:hypothetical protein